MLPGLLSNIIQIQINIALTQLSPVRSQDLKTLAYFMKKEMFDHSPASDEVKAKALESFSTTCRHMNSELEDSQHERFDLNLSYEL